MSDTSPGPSRRSIVLVVGPGRSGTSSFSGILKRLGHRVPQPEVPPNESNPRGFAESSWVTGFHERVMGPAGVQPSDARPAAGDLVAARINEAVTEKLRAFLVEQFAESDHLVIKDPRIIWFLPLWQQVSAELDVTPRIATMLRHPSAVVRSVQLAYGNRRVPISWLAGWVNTILVTERATRDALRAFVPYDDLLADWTKTVTRVTETLEVPGIGEASEEQIAEAEEFVDPSLRRSATSWEGMQIPVALKEQAEQVWHILGKVADADAASVRDLAPQLDAISESYRILYEEAEGIAQSSILAANRQAAVAKKAAAKKVAAAKKAAEDARAEAAARLEKATATKAATAKMAVPPPLPLRMRRAAGAALRELRKR